MNFQEAERRYDELKRQFDVGTIGVHEFNAQRQQLMVQDDEGRWWAKSPDSDEWNYHDGSAWVPATPQGKTDDFEEAERRYAELKRQFDAGSIDADYFNAQRQRLMVHDDEGRWWAKSPDSDEWNYHDGSAWVPGTTSGYQEVTSEPTDSPAQTLSPPPPKGVENGENGRQRMPPWVLVAWLGGISLVGIVLGWALVPYLRDEPAPIEQGEPIQSEQGEQKPDGAALDAVFIHRATRENISRQSTYLDHPLTNDNPNAILYVTQNWSPRGGGGAIYNDHPIGVWYDQEDHRWAIFNQDREAMPDGAAFNVAVLEEPAEAR